MEKNGTWQKLTIGLFLSLCLGFWGWVGYGMVELKTFKESGGRFTEADGARLDGRVTALESTLTDIKVSLRDINDKLDSMDKPH